jgi:hypothetical protein
MNLVNDHVQFRNLLATVVTGNHGDGVLVSVRHVALLDVRCVLDGRMEYWLCCGLDVSLLVVEAWWQWYVMYKYRTFRVVVSFATVAFFLPSRFYKYRFVLSVQEFVPPVAFWVSSFFHGCVHSRDRS